MASFTDSVRDYNPYIAQLPVEAMVTVGARKEQEFQAGIQKVQSYYDSLSGLDIIKDEDKAYVQQKLQAIKQNISTNLSGDFGDQRVINQIGSGIKQIYRDPIIQNGVSSTAHYRREVASMEEFKKKGESSAANEWEFQDKATKWLSDKTAGTSFNGKYTSFTDYRKKSLEILKSVTGNSSLKDDALIFDEAGNVTGIKDAMTRTKMAGISAEQIQSALMAGLGTNEFRQMEIDGRYNYSNKPPEQFADDLYKDYDTKRGFFKGQRKVLENALSSTNSSAVKDQINAQIASLDKTITNVEEEYADIAKTLESGDAESAKARLHATKFLSGFARAFSHTEIEQTYHSSPFVQAQQFRETKAQDWQKHLDDYNQRESHFKVNTELKVEENRLKAEENQIKKDASAPYGGLPGTINQANLPQYSIESVTKDVTEAEKGLNQANQKFIADNGKDQAWFDQQRIAYEKNPKGVDPIIASHFNNVVLQEREIKSKQNMITDIKSEAAAKFGDIYSAIPANAPNITYTSPEGKYVYSPRDFVDFTELRSKYSKTVSGWTSGGSSGGGSSSNSTVVDMKKAKAELSPKMYKLFEVAEKANVGLNKADQVLSDNIKNYKKLVNLPNHGRLAEQSAFSNAELQKRITNSQGVSYGIEAGTAAQRSSIGTVLIDFAKLADSQTGGIADSPNFSSADAREIAADTEAKYSINVIEATRDQPAKYRITATGKDKQTEFVLTEEQKRSVFGNRFESTPALSAFKQYGEQIRMMGGRTTNLAKTTDIGTAYLSNIDFPAAKTYSIKADIIQASPGQYSLRLNIYDPITKTWKKDLAIPRGGLTDETGITNAIQGLNDASIYQLLDKDNKAPTAADLKKVEEASKPIF